MEERRVFFSSFGLQKHNSKVVEHELDMVRNLEGPPAGVAALTRIFNWLMPSARIIAPPMRSVARELEEAFPGRDS